MLWLAQLPTSALALLIDEGVEVMLASDIIVYFKLTAGVILLREVTAVIRKGTRPPQHHWNVFGTYMKLRGQSALAGPAIFPSVSRGTYSVTSNLRVQSLALLASRQLSASFSRWSEPEDSYLSF